MLLCYLITYNYWDNIMPSVNQQSSLSTFKKKSPDYLVVILDRTRNLDRQNSRESSVSSVTIPVELLYSSRHVLDDISSSSSSSVSQRLISASHSMQEKKILPINYKRSHSI
jgi:hypothetical protein